MEIKASLQGSLGSNFYYDVYLDLPDMQNFCLLVGFSGEKAHIKKKQDQDPGMLNRPFSSFF